MPHLISSILAYSLKDCQNEAIEFAGNGLLDTTRIAEGDPSLWKTIFQHNKHHVLHSLDRIEKTIALVRKALKEENMDNFEAFLKSASDFRKGISR